MANSLEYYSVTKKKTLGGWFYCLILVVSFLCIDFYITVSSETVFISFSGNNIFASSQDIAYIFGLTVIEALIDWLVLEVIMWLYRTILSLKIYSFVVPAQTLKNECRLFFAIKNFLLAIIVNLCFAYPYLYSFVEAFNVLFLVLTLVTFAWHIQRRYSEPIIAHFVFKCFCYPIFFYECVVLLVSYLGVLI